MALRRGARRAREHHAPAAAAPLARAEPGRERLQFMRDNWLSNRVYIGYADIVARCSAAWNDPIDHPWRIRSIGLWTWAEEF